MVGKDTVIQLFLHLIGLMRKGEHHPVVISWEERMPFGELETKYAHVDRINKQERRDDLFIVTVAIDNHREIIFQGAFIANGSLSARINQEIGKIRQCPNGLFKDIAKIRLYFESKYEEPIIRIDEEWPPA